VELDAAAAVAGESLSVSQRNQLSQRTNAWAYFDTLVSSNVGLGESAPVLRAMARSHCASEGEVKALAARVAGSSASVPSAHAVLHDAWLGLGPSGVGRALDTLSDAIRTGACTQADAGRVATTALRRCRGSGSREPGVLGVAREDYFAKLQQVRLPESCCWLCGRVAAAAACWL
jgi:hypothetical protein